MITAMRRPIQTAKVPGEAPYKPQKKTGINIKFVANIKSTAPENIYNVFRDISFLL
jgi:hypothetical protein